MFFVFGLVLQSIFLSPSLLVWALCNRYKQGVVNLNSYLATFLCFLAAIVTAFAFKIEFEGGLITGIFVFSVLSFFYSIAFGVTLLIVKFSKASKNA